MRACCSTYICKTKIDCFFTTLTTSKAIKSAELETKNIISEFNRQSTNPEMPDDNLSPGGEEAALDQDINF